MTAPRQVLPGTTYLITRRCAQRQLLLRPSQSTTEIFLYLLALAARRYGMRVHAFCVLSNHYHLVATDPEAQLPKFQQLLDGLMAKAINASLGRRESFWAPSSFSAVTLVSPQDVVDKAAYTLANPVAAGLVRTSRQWPGAWSDPDAIGSGAAQVRRPQVYFDRQGHLPASLELELSVPPGFASPGEFREWLATSLAKRESAALRGSPRIMGVQKVLSQRPTGRPRSCEPMFRLKPRVASQDKWKRIEALGRLAAFLDSYREALAAWRERRASAVFPAGTYLMRIAHGVPCAQAG